MEETKEINITEVVKKSRDKNILIAFLVVALIVLVVLCSVFGIRVNEQESYNIAYISMTDEPWHFIAIKSYKIKGNFIELIDKTDTPLLLSGDKCILMKDDTMYRSLTGGNI